MISSASTSLNPRKFIAAAAVVGLIANDIVSLFASVVALIPVPPAKVKSSSFLSAPKLVCPETWMFAYASVVTLLRSPPSPLAIALTVSTELILPYVSTVILGIAVALPYIPAVTPVATKFNTAFALLPVPPVTVICPDVPAILCA